MSHLVLAMLLALAAHEGGHYAAGRAYGYLCKIGWGWLGPYTVIGADLQPGAIVGVRARVIAASGPAMNVLLLILALSFGWTWDAVVQLDMLALASLRDYRRAVFGVHPA